GVSSVKYHSIHLRATERLLPEIELEDVVEQSPRAERLPASVALDVVGEPGARRQLVFEAELDGIRAQPVDVAARVVGGNFLALGADTEVQRQLAADRPRVLNEEPVDIRPH